MKLNTTKRFFAIILSALMLLSSLGSSIAFAAEGTPAFTFAPGQGGGKVIHKDIDPGDSIKGIMKIRLLDDVPTLLNIVFNDSSSSKARTLLKTGANVDDLVMASWLNLPDGERVFMDAKGNFNVPYEFNIPEGVPPGDYAGIFTAVIAQYGDELLENYDPSTDTLKGVGVGVRVSIAMGVEFLIRIAGELFPQLTFENLSHFVSNDGSLNLVLKYRNEGNVSVIPRANIVISDLFGKRLYNGDFKFLTVSPGESVDSTAHLSLDDFNFVYGIYTIEVELLYDIYNFSKDSVPAVYVSGIGALKIYSIPWVVVLVVSLIIVLILAWFVFRNLRDMSLYKYSKEYVVKENDTLQSLSKKFSLNPKKIILVNKLKEPYFLSVGKKILIPQGKTKK